MTVEGRDRSGNHSSHSECCRYACINRAVALDAEEAYFFYKASIYRSWIRSCVITSYSIHYTKLYEIYNLYNPLVYSTGDIIDTWVYRAGLVELQFSLATAVGLLKSVVSFVLIV